MRLFPYAKVIPSANHPVKHVKERITVDIIPLVLDVSELIFDGDTVGVRGHQFHHHRTVADVGAVGEAEEKTTVAFLIRRESNHAPARDAERHDVHDPDLVADGVGDGEGVQAHGLRPYVEQSNGYLAKSIT